MKIKTKELREKSNEELMEMKKTAEHLIMMTAGVKPKIKPEQKKVPRKLIARILTIINERKNG